MIDKKNCGELERRIKTRVFSKLGKVIIVSELTDPNPKLHIVEKKLEADPASNVPLIKILPANTPPKTIPEKTMLKMV